MSNEIVPVTRRDLARRGPVASVPAFIADAGDDAARRFIEFFTVNIRNKNTREAYFRAVSKFADWCDGRGLRLDALEPVAVAAYIEELGNDRPEPTVKQALAAIRMLFDWMVTGHIIAVNPAHAVRGPRYNVRRGKTPVLDAEQARQLSTPSTRTPLSAFATEPSSLLCATLSPASVPSRRSRLRISSTRANAGGFGFKRRTERSSKCPPITTLKLISTHISTPPAFARAARVPSFGGPTKKTIASSLINQ